jgi:hypothetical protein
MHQFSPLKVFFLDETAERKSNSLKFNVKMKAQEEFPFI